MSNTFYISIKPLIDSCLAILQNNQVNIQDIHNTDLPAVCTLATGIKAKTDLTPQNVRGKYKHANLSADSSSFTDVVNVSGHGKIDHISFLVDDPADTGELRLEIDGEAAMDLSLIGDDIEYNVVPSPRQIDNSFLFLHTIPYSDTEVVHFNMEFSSSLLLQIRRSEGTAAFVRCKIIYTLDQF